jgi:hypothetical protein
MHILGEKIVTTFMMVVIEPAPGQTTGLLQEEKTSLIREMLSVEKTEILENGVLIVLVALLQHAMLLRLLILSLGRKKHTSCVCSTLTFTSIGYNDA